MSVLKRFRIAVLVFMITTNFVFAQDIMCSRVLSNDDLVGSHSLIVGPGTLSGSGYTFPFPQSPASAATIRLLDGEILLESSDGHMKMTLFQLFDDDEQWSFPDSPVFVLKDTDKIAALGCAMADLPRYLGQGWFISEDGVTVASTMHLIINGLNKDGGISATGIMISKADGLALELKIELGPASN